MSNLRWVKIEYVDTDTDDKFLDYLCVDKDTKIYALLEAAMPKNNHKLTNLEVFKLASNKFHQLLEEVKQKNIRISINDKYQKHQCRC